MNRNEITMQLYTTRKFQPYEPIFKFLSDSGIENIELHFDINTKKKFKSSIVAENIQNFSKSLNFTFAVNNYSNSISISGMKNLKYMYFLLLFIDAS